MNIPVANQYSTAHAIAFMNRNGYDAAGRSLDDYWNFSLDKWEECHNHIQWAFPSDVASDFNANAPVVDMRKYVDGLDYNGHHNQNWLIKHYLLSLGLLTTADNVNFQLTEGNPLDRIAIWLNPHDHNYRRITRLLNLLYYFNRVQGDELLQKFLTIRDFANMIKPDCIDEQTVLYWRLANAGTLTRYV